MGICGRLFGIRGWWWTSEQHLGIAPLAIPHVYNASLAGGTQNVWLLVDYDNFESIDKERGVTYCIHTVLQAIGPSAFDPNEAVFVRLYGGWYEGATLSRNAQDLTAQIAGVFPNAINVQTEVGSCSLRVSVQLARSLLVDPGNDLLHTFRPRGYPGGLSVAALPFDGCVQPAACPVAPISRFLTDRCCPQPACSVHPKKAITRAEQKLVDTMLTADLVDLALQGEKVAVVSSDDDVWPGIRLSVSRSAPILHVHTRRGQTTPPQYTAGLGDSYTQLRMAT
jgi:hypothetical protein